ncbi:hypothetical protein PLESTF_001540300 [Pleodorina starrii]|nr:hypothetical protein PLESTM_001869000 [Pleodorina starrii]GLC74658.1 hypothetical protein PLESTF_001540300 [Pleodorina starrii]
MPAARPSRTSWTAFWASSPAAGWRRPGRSRPARWLPRLPVRPGRRCCRGSPGALLAGRPHPSWAPPSSVAPSCNLPRRTVISTRAMRISLRTRMTARCRRCRLQLSVTPCAASGGCGGKTTTRRRYGDWPCMASRGSRCCVGMQVVGSLPAARVARRLHRRGDVGSVGTCFGTVLLPAPCTRSWTPCWGHRVARWCSGFSYGSWCPPPGSVPACGMLWLWRPWRCWSVAVNACTGGVLPPPPLLGLSWSALVRRLLPTSGPASRRSRPLGPRRLVGRRSRRITPSSPARRAVWCLSALRTLSPLPAPPDGFGGSVPRAPVSCPLFALSLLAVCVLVFVGAAAAAPWCCEVICYVAALTFLVCRRD